VIIESPWASLAVGIAVAVLALLLWVVTAGADALALLALLLRFLHIFAAAVWLGLIVFVNFVQLAAIGGASEGQRAFLAQAVIPQVATWMRHASTTVVASGVLLLFTAGYLLATVAYGTAVYVGPVREGLLWAAVVAALAMWTMLHMYIWPAMQVALGLRQGDAEAKQKAEARVRLLARLNLMLAVPVLFVMVAAAHL
jgi:uncharacterized membrane protein